MRPLFRTLLALMLAVVVAGCGFQHEQRLVAVDNVERAQLAFKVRGELFTLEQHQSSSSRSGFFGLMIDRRRMI